jgi:hypothetical protein
MPRRRDPIKEPELPTLLRNAQPTRREIDGEPNLRKRRERLRARDAAIDTLMRMDREADKHGSRPDERVRNFIEALKASNDGCLPRPRGGAPARTAAPSLACGPGA